MKLVDLLISTRQAALKLLEDIKDSNGTLLGWGFVPAFHGWDR